MSDEKPNQKMKAVFKILPMENVKNIASKVTKVLPKKTLKNKYKKKGLSNIERKVGEVNTVHENHQFPVENGSIQEFINHCHPDLRNFIKTNEIGSVKALTHGLRIITKNKFEISIDTLSKHSARVEIRDRKRHILYQGDSQVFFVKEKV